MLTFSHSSSRARRLLPYAIALVLGLGWASREVALAAERAVPLGSAIVSLGAVDMKEYKADNKPVGKLGVYLSGDTPASSKFVTGRLVLDAGQSPHPPHVHPEEEVMIIESGTGEIFCDGKTTPVGPGSVMYTTPQSSHGIVNTGDKPIVFYFIKWASKPNG